MATIELTQGKVALVDDDLADWLRQWNWWAFYSESRDTWYAQRQCPTVDGSGITVTMHRQILGLVPGDGRFGDHANGDGLDNRRSNLRVATVQQNNWNARLRRDNTTGFKGVRFRNGRFHAELKSNGERYYLGSFETAEEAGKAYAAAAKEHHGEFASSHRKADAK